MSPRRTRSQDPVDNPSGRRLSETADAVSGREYREDDLLRRASTVVRHWKSARTRGEGWTASCLEPGCGWEQFDASWQECRLAAHQHEEDEHSPTSLWMNHDAFDAC